MQENHLFEYAVIRVVPRVEREEFINAGVILYCAAEKFLDVLFDLNNERLQAFAGDADLIEIKDHLLAFDRICKGGAGGGPLLNYPLQIVSGGLRQPAALWCKRLKYIRVCVLMLKKPLASCTISW